MDYEKIRFYRGSSMAGTFRPGDILILEPIDIVKIRPGDVVVYLCQDRQEAEAVKHPRNGDPPTEAVHRVVSILSEGLVTRGDNNSSVDRELVTQKNLVGLVTHIERGRKQSVVSGGLAGLMHTRILQTKHILWRLLSRLGGGLYRRLRSSGFITKIWHPKFTRIYLLTDEGLMVKYTHTSRTIASWLPKKERFICQKPFDLVLWENNAYREEIVDQKVQSLIIETLTNSQKGAD